MKYLTITIVATGLNDSIRYYFEWAIDQASEAYQLPITKGQYEQLLEYYRNTEIQEEDLSHERISRKRKYTWKATWTKREAMETHNSNVWLIDFGNEKETLIVTMEKDINTGILQTVLNRVIESYQAQQVPFFEDTPNTHEIEILNQAEYQLFRSRRHYFGSPTVIIEPRVKVNNTDCIGKPKPSDQ